MMEGLAWATLFETLIVTSAGFVTLYLSANTVSKKSIYTNTNPTIIIYVWYQILWSFTTVIYCLYVLILWRPDIILYENKTFYSIGLPSYFLLFLNTIIEGFLGIDRIFTILYPWKYKDGKKKIFGGCMLIFLLLYVIFLFYAYDFINIFFDNLTMSCRFFGCILVIRDYPDYAYTLKLGAVGITASIGLLLFGLTKKFLKKINKSKKMHNTIIVIIASTTVCEFFPSVVSQVYNSITGDTLSLYLGPYRTTLIAVNISFCSWIYYKTLKKNFTKNGINSRMHPSSFNAIQNHTKSAANQSRQVITISP